MDDYRAASLQGWSAVAPDWAELTSWVDRQLGPAAEWMIDAAALKPGERVLELAGGPGTISLMACRAVGPEGKVIYTDFAEPMVAAGSERMAAEGAGNVEARVMDAEAIDLPDGAVDAVLCRMGYMLMADPGAALRETARVLRADGRVALAVWSEAPANPWAALGIQTIMEHTGAPPPPPGTPGIFALADEQRLTELLAQAGLEDVRVEQLDGEVGYDSFEQWYELTGRLAGPVRALLAGFEEDARNSIKQRWRERASSYERPDGSFVMPERMVVASARA